MFYKFEEELETIINKEKTMGIRELATLLIKEEGREEGREQTQATIITNLLEKSDHTFQEIAAFAGVPIDVVIEIRNSLLTK